ncbi:restriction endonuclease subunit S [[Eubacterium] tenue]|nr:restriction endonuclease subunit S [[Eubacterium] tenue]MBC8630501.1 restriction endonuclease subunit S [[Eubacterium] tenue]
MSKKLPEGWKRVKLLDLCDLIRGTEPGSASYTEDTRDIRFLRISDISKSNDKYIYTNSSKIIEVREDDLLISLDGTPGIVVDGMCGAISSGIRKICIKDENILNKTYLKYYLRSELVQQVIRKYSTGATILHASKSIPYIEVQFPCIEEQERIVSILEKAEKAIQKREESNRLLDEYLKSVFIDIFGDPVTNTKGWEKIKLKDAGILERGKSKHRPRNAPELLGGIYPLIQTGDIANSGMYLSEYNQTYSEIGLKQSKMWNKGTLAITIAANIAKTSILGIDACFPDSVVGFIPNQCTNVEFVCLWMTFLQSMIEKNAPESAQKNINLKILGELDIIIPNIELQNKFAKIVHSIEVIKNKQMKSNKELENLFNSLMQKAFNGEL